MEKSYHFPQTVMFEFDQNKIKDPMRSKMFGEQKNAQFYGVVVNRVWEITPGHGWNISMTEHGVYTISQPTGHSSYSLNYNLVDLEQGEIKLISMCDKELVFETKDKQGNLVSLDFLFCMSVIKKA